MCRYRGAWRRVLAYVLVLLGLCTLAAQPACWGDATGLYDTVPRETPTRPPTVTPTPTATQVVAPTATSSPTSVARPPATASPTPAPEQPTNTPAPAATITQTPQPVSTATSTPSSVGTRIPPPSATVASPVATVAMTPIVLPAVSPTSAQPVASPPPPTLPPTVAATFTPAVFPRSCLADVSAPLVLHSPDGSIVVGIPSGSITATLCLSVGLLEPGDVPLPPAGYRLATPIARLLVTDSAGQVVRGVSFGEPLTLTLRYTDLGVDSTAPVIGFLGEASNAWAILEGEHDSKTHALITRPRRPGVFAVLSPVPVEGPVQASAEPRSFGPPMAIALAGVVAVGVIAGIVVRWRRRPS